MCDYPVHPGDLVALRTLYNAAGGPMWRRANGGWQTADDSVAACDAHWDGVNFTNRQDCSNGGGRSGMFPCALVDNVTLVNNNLVGSLPGGLTFQALRRLSIVDNPRLTGTVPWCDWVAQPFSTTLTSLLLANNGHTGGLPQDLTINGRSNCNLASFSQLFEINLASNRFSGPCNSTTWPPRLQRLVVWANNFSGPVPNETIGRLTDINTIDLGANRFSGTFPLAWANANRTVRKVTLAQNPNVGGSLPSNLGGLINTQFLYLDTCGFSGSLPNMSAMRALTLANFASNQFSGSLPDHWGLGMPAIAELLVHNNPLLEGPIPPSWNNLQQLTSIDISYTAINGTLAHLVSWQPKSVNVARSRIVCCEIPAGWPATLQSLRFAGATVVSNASLLPAAASWPNLHHLVLAELNLTASVDVDAAALLGSVILPGMAPRLSVISLHGIGLTGKRPVDDLCLWPNLTVFDLADNNFTSTQPLSRNRCSGGRFPLQLVDVTPMAPLDTGATEGAYSVDTLTLGLFCPPKWFPGEVHCLSDSTAYRLTNKTDVMPDPSDDSAVLNYILQGQLGAAMTFAYVAASSSLVAKLIFYDQLGGVVLLLTPRLLIWVTPRLQILPDEPTEQQGNATCEQATGIPSWHKRAVLYSSGQVGTAGTMQLPFDASTLAGGCEYRLWFDIHVVDQGLQDSPARWASENSACPCPPTQSLTIAGPVFTRLCQPLMAALPGQPGCAECPALAECNGTTIITTRSRAWRPNALTGYVSCNSHDVGCNSNGSCLPGYGGRMCSLCQGNHTRIGQSCVRCWEEHWLNISLVVTCLLVVCVFLFLAVYVSVMSCARRGQATEPTNAVRRWMQRTSRVMPCIKLLLNQLAFVAILFRCKATATMTSGTLSIVGPIQQQIARLGMLSLLPCVFVQYESYFDGLVYASLAVALCIVYVPIYSLFGPTYRFKWLTVVVTVFQIYYFSIVDATAQTLFEHRVTLPPLAKQSVAMPLDNEALRLYGNSTVLQYLPGSSRLASGSFFALMMSLFVVVGVIFLVAAAITFFVLERTDQPFGYEHHRIAELLSSSESTSMASTQYTVSLVASDPVFKTTTNTGATPSSPLGSRDDLTRLSSDGANGSSFSLAQTVFFFIVQNYKCDHWYWDFLFSARKLVCVVIAAAPLDAMPQLLLFLAASFGYLAVVLWQKPYLSKWLFRADIAASTCLVLSIVFASFSTGATQTSYENGIPILGDGYTGWIMYPFVASHLAGLVLMIAGFAGHIRDSAAGRLRKLYGRRQVESLAAAEPGETVSPAAVAVNSTTRDDTQPLSSYDSSERPSASPESTRASRVSAGGSSLRSFLQRMPQSQLLQSHPDLP